MHASTRHGPVASPLTARIGSVIGDFDNAGLTATSRVMHDTLAMACAVAATGAAVLLLGEIGTGKEFLARTARAPR